LLGAKIIFVNIIILSVPTIITASQMQEELSLAAAQTNSDFNLAAVGDWGCSSDAENTLDNILDKDPELVLGLGDYSYEDLSADCWLDIIEPIDDKMKIAIGNHEDKSSSALNQYMDHFNLTKQYYSFNYQNVHFVAMSTELPYESGSEQHSFVNDDLSLAAANPDIEWIIVFYHKPAYTSPSDHPESTTLQEVYHPLFGRYGVDIVLQAHNHNYQRSYPISYNSDNPSEPIITDSETNNYNDPRGQIFTIVGTGGVNHHSLLGQAPYIFYQQSSFYGFLNVEISEEGTRLNAQFYDNIGKVMDEFSIVKPTSIRSHEHQHENYIT
jgi:hypothetical protein